jgi:hypothetical protein
METTYGQKGGMGPTAGKKATTYRVTLADGTVLKKRSFHRDAPELWAIVVTVRGRTSVTLWDDFNTGAGTVPSGTPFISIRAVREA